MASADGSPGGTDNGDVIIGWIVRLVAGLAVVGVISFDALSIGSSRLSIEDQANSAARAAADTWATSHDAQAAFDSAWTVAVEANATNQVDPKSFVIDPQGQARVTVTRDAPTFVVHLMRPLRHWSLVSSTAVSKASV